MDFAFFQILYHIIKVFVHILINIKTIIDILTTVTIDNIVSIF